MKKKSLTYKLLQRYELYLFILPATLYFAIFNYAPMYGVQLAFKDFIATKGIWGSPWVGLKHLDMFFESYYFWTLMKNTIGISLYSLIAGFPFPILLALLLNEVRNKHYRKIVQTVTYAPHFISMVVMVGMILIYLNPQYGIINKMLEYFNHEPIDFINKPAYFKTIYVWSGIWQGTGFGSIIYFAALSSVDPEQHEAAIIDGASRLQRIIHVNIPVLIPTATILLILNMGGIMSVGFEKIFLMQTPLNVETSDVISTYVYKVGLLQARYGFSSAVGLFNSLINCFLLVIVNGIVRRYSEISLW